jgi:hypothetical protein
MRLGAVALEDASKLARNVAAANHAHLPNDSKDNNCFLLVVMWWHWRHAQMLNRKGSIKDKPKLKPSWKSGILRVVFIWDQK